MVSMPPSLKATSQPASLLASCHFRTAAQAVWPHGLFVALVLGGLQPAFSSLALASFSILGCLLVRIRYQYLSWDAFKYYSLREQTFMLIKSNNAKQLFFLLPLWSDALPTYCQSTGPLSERKWGKLQPAGQGPILSPELYWNTVMPVCSHLVCGYVHTTAAEQRTPRTNRNSKDPQSLKQLLNSY